MNVILIMGPNEKLFKKAYSHELLRIAENDFLSGQTLAKVDQIRKETVLFHFEQVVEKSLKAVLCFLGKPVPITHDIYALVQRFDESDFPPGGYALHDLTPFATIRRYEEGNYILDQQDLDSAEKMCCDVLKWAKEKMSWWKTWGDFF